MQKNLLAAALALPLLTASILLVGAPAACAADGWAGTALTATDSVRTNLWLCDSLMEKAVLHAAGSLPPAPGAIRLDSKGKAEGQDLLGQIVYDVLADAGFDVYSAMEDTSQQAAVDYVVTYQLKEAELEYPRVGRTLGIWRRWVDRDMSVAVDIQILEAATGRILFRDLVRRQFADRLAASDVADVESQMFAFTAAEASEGGWRRRLEEIVVVGSLAGMVAVYFANTGN